MAAGREGKTVAVEDGALADAAGAGLALAQDPAATQAELEGMDYTKVQFVGVQFDTLETDVKIGDEMLFLVRGRVKAVGDEQMADGHVRHTAKVKVDSVTLHDQNDGPSQG